MKSLILSLLLLTMPLCSAPVEKNDPDQLAEDVSLGSALFAFELRDELINGGKFGHITLLRLLMPCHVRRRSKRENI